MAENFHLKSCTVFNELRMEKMAIFRHVSIMIVDNLYGQLFHTPVYCDKCQPLSCRIYFSKHEIIFFISQHWKKRSHLANIKNIAAGDGLLRQGGRASAAMVLTYFSLYFPVSALEESLDTQPTLSTMAYLPALSPVCETTVYSHPKLHLHMLEGFSIELCLTQCFFLCMFILMV